MMKMLLLNLDLEPKDDPSRHLYESIKEKEDATDMKKSR